MTSRQNPRDSLFTVSWEPVTGAVAYVLQIYDLPGIAPTEAVSRGAPAPFFDGQANEVFVGLIDAPRTDYTIGDTTSTDVTIMQRRTTFFARIYIVRVTAIDDGGQMIATTRGSNGIVFTEIELPDASRVPGYGLFPLGGQGVCPTPPTASAEARPIDPSMPALLADGRVAWRIPSQRIR